MIIYHGTTKKQAEKIKGEKIIKGEGKIGPLISLTLEQAISYAINACNNEKLNSEKEATVIMIEHVPSLILNNASKAGMSESFTLNDEFGNPLKGFNFQKVQILSLREARYFIFNTKTEFTKTKKHGNN